MTDIADSPPLETATPEDVDLVSRGIGRVIRSRRRALLLHQRELAAKAGISRSALNRIETGRQSPRLDTLIAVLDKLEMDLVIEPSPPGTHDINKTIQALSAGRGPRSVV